MSRYPKRKRKVASYADASVDHEGDGDDDLDLTNNGTQLVKPKQARIAGRAKRRNVFRFMLLLDVMNTSLSLQIHRDLPGELRNMIYDYLLCQPEGNDVWIREENSRVMPRRRLYFTLSGTSVGRDSRRLGRTSLNNFGILRLNKEVNSEAMSILYYQCFHFCRMETMQTFLLRLSPNALSLLRNVECEAYVTTEKFNFLPAVFSLLRPAFNIQRLKV